MVRIESERISSDVYIEFLKRTDLGSQYPKERFQDRIKRLVENASVSLTARNDDGGLVGVLFAITDFAYWLFITDLGVDRRYVNQGIGTRLMKRAMEEAGGEKDIIMYTCANENAVGFYEKYGMKQANDVFVYNHAEWTQFTVGKEED